MCFLIHKPYIWGPHKNVKTGMSVSVYTEAKGGGAEGDGNDHKMLHAPSEKKSVIHE